MKAQKSSLFWLVVAMTLVTQACSQHWSYGLRPGGKREVESLQDTLQDIAEEVRKLDAIRQPGCADVSPQSRLSSLRELLASLAEEERGRKNI
ncbi:progonadoliberin-1 [Lepisosteus oculatus]|uniref:Progonadoliberin n=1 Tax=Lepisosteus oculatus TaxID=7918 RepID=W5NCT6_LEPOC|nr:PREDICTED: progonadoliberin-1 [Lepisosteus oculatus]